MPLQFIKSQRNKDHLVHLGYRYRLKSEGEKENIWNCVEDRHHKCRGRVYTANNEVVRIFNEHNHTPDIAKIEAKQVSNNIILSAQTKSDPPNVIVASCTEGISKSAAAVAPRTQFKAKN